MNKFFFIAISAGNLLSATAPVLDPGGVSLDFTKVQPVAAMVDKKENLIADGTFDNIKIAPQLWKLPNGCWGADSWVHLGSADGDCMALLKKIQPFIRREIVSEDTNKFARLSSGLEAWQFHDNKDRELFFSNTLLQRTVLPDNAEGKNYILTFRYRGKLETQSNKNVFLVFLRFRNHVEYTQGKELSYCPEIQFKLGLSWDNGKMKFTVPAGAKLIDVRFTFYGPGRLDIDDVSLCEAVPRGALAVDLLPQTQIDKLYRMGERVPNVLTFDVIDPGEVPRKNPRFEFVLPNGFWISDCELPLLEKQKTEEGVKYIFSLDQWRFAKKYMLSYQINMMIRSELPAGKKCYAASYRTVNNGAPGTWRNFNFIVMPKITALQPKRFVTGSMLIRQHRLPLQKSKNDFVNFYADCGFNRLQSWLYFDRESGQILKKRGVFRSVEPYFISNAYRFGGGPKPENAFFRLADGTPFTEPGGKTFAICPSEMVERGPHFRAVAEELIHKPIAVDDTADTVMVNHEPFYYAGKGCFCTRCRSRFTAYLSSKNIKFDLDDFNRGWAGSISGFSGEWTKFLSWQHGRAVVALEAAVLAAGKQAGKDSHYIPEINWAQLEPSSLTSFPYYAATDYISELAWLQPWGPYIFHSMEEKYIYTPGIHLTTYAAGKMVRDFLKQKIGDPKKIPKLIAFPHGIQGQGIYWVTEPEASAFETLCVFLNRWEGSILYMHNNMDYIYYSELAKTNALIARYEDFIFDGTERNADKVENLTPIIGEKEFRPWLNGDKISAFLCLKQEKFAPAIGRENALRMKSFQLGDQRLIAVGNFWQRGECFFNLQLEDIDPECRYAVCQPHEKRIFGVFTGKELKKGITLHAGALRWAFYLIEPVRENVDYGYDITQKFMNSERERRLPEIAAAYAKERETAEKWEKLYAAELNEEREATEGTSFEFGVMPLVSSESGKVVVSPIGQGSAAPLRVSTPQYMLKLNSALGAAITEWRTAKGEPLSVQESDTTIGKDTILAPFKNSFELKHQMRLVAVAPVSDGVQIVLERKLSANDNRNLRGIVVTKKMLFRPQGFVIETTLRNPTAQPVVITYRQHNFAPLSWKLNGKSGGIAVGKSSFVRDMRHKLLRIGADSIPELEKFLDMKSEPVDSAAMLFSAPWSPMKIRVEPLDGQKPQAMLIWECGNHATAEYISASRVLLPNGIFKFGSCWTLSE